MKASDSLILFSHYSREDLKALFKITDATINNGIFQPKGHSSIWIFITKNKTSDRTNYKDDFDGLTLNFEGQLTGRTDIKIINHSNDGNEILLFYRERKNEYPNYAFRYFGRFKYISSSGSEPRKFTLQTIDIGLEDTVEFSSEKEQETTQIETKNGLIRKLMRKTTKLKEIDLTETNEKITEIEGQLITYARNEEAQEKANSLHQKSLIILAEYFSDLDLIPKESVIDLLVENQNKVFIFEVKSVHADNFRSQTRSAIGQLFEYEFFEVKSKFHFKDMEIQKGILYSKEPPKKYIEFLESFNLGVYWINNDTIVGSKESMRRLNDFVL